MEMEDKIHFLLPRSFHLHVYDKTPPTTPTLPTHVHFRLPPVFGLRSQHERPPRYVRRRKKLCVRLSQQMRRLELFPRPAVGKAHHLDQLFRVHADTFQVCLQNVCVCIPPITTCFPVLHLQGYRNPWMCICL